MHVDEFAHLKLISQRSEGRQYCFMLWTCRKSRQGVHAFCNTQTISKRQRSWILSEYARIDSSLSPAVVNQDDNYLGGVCFKN